MLYNQHCYRKGDLQNQEDRYGDSEFCVLGLVTEELHPQKCADCSIQCGHQNEMCLGSAPFFGFGIVLIQPVHYKGDEIDHRQHCEDDDCVGFHKSAYGRK